MPVVCLLAVFFSLSLSAKASELQRYIIITISYQLSEDSALTFAGFATELLPRLNTVQHSFKSAIQLRGSALSLGCAIGRANIIISSIIPVFLQHKNTVCFVIILSVFLYCCLKHCLLFSCNCLSGMQSYCDGVSVTGSQRHQTGVSDCD